MRRLFLLVALLAIAAGPVQGVVGQQDLPDQIPDHEPLEFRPHLVPEAEILEQIQGLRPLKRDDFERMVATINARAASADSAARVIRAVYTARLDGEQLVAGRARLEIVHEAETPSYLALDAVRIPINGLLWSGNDPAAMRAGLDSRGRSLVVVQGSGALEFSWSLRGSRDPARGLQFTASLPESPVNQLLLHLPAGVRPDVDKGIAAPLRGEAAREYLLADDELESPSAGEGQYWLVELGGRHTLDLRILPGGRSGDQRQALLQEAFSYQLTEAGIELRARFSLDVSAAAQRNLLLHVDPPLEIATARLGDKSLTFRRGEDPTTVLVELSQSLLGSEREVSITAFAPLEVGSLWQLPAIRAKDAIPQPGPLPRGAAEGLAWQQGSATLHVPGTLLLRRLDLEGYAETLVEPWPLPEAGETRHFQAYAPGATLKVEIGHRPSLIQIDSGRSIRLGAGRVRAQIVADIRSRQGDRFVIDAVRSAAWIIDSVETVPADALDGYDFGGTRGRRLQIRLSRPVSPQEPVRLVIQAHRGVPARAYYGSEFRPLQFRDVSDQQHHVSLYPEAPFHLFLTGDAQVERLAATDLSPSELERMDIPAGAVVYRDSPEASSMRVERRSEKPRYSARIAVEAIAEPNRLKQVFQIRCEPESSQVSRVLIHLSQARDDALVWSLDEESEGILAARRMTSGTALSGGETWEVALRQPTVEPFTLRAVRVVPLLPESTVALASVPEATSQSGTLQIGAAGGARLSIEASGLKSIPAALPEPDRYPQLAAQYRYDPSRDAQVSVAPAAAEELPPAAWVWDCRVVTRWQRSGLAEHEATLMVENTGAQQVTIELPPAVDLQSAAVDAVESFSAAPAFSGTLTLGLPPGQRFPVIRLRYLTEGPALRFLDVAEAPWPRVDLPCLQRTWSVWLPPGYRAVNDQRFLPDSRPLELRWDERLFGISLFRRSGRPFDPFSSADWGSLARHLALGGDAAGSQRAFLSQIAQLTADGASRTWGDLLTRYANMRDDDVFAGSLPELLIETGALARMGMTPQSRLDSTGKSSWAPEDLFAQRDLALVIDGETVLLTTLAGLSRFSQQTRPTRNGNVVLVRSSRSLSELSSPSSWLSHVTTPQQWAQGVGESLPAVPQGLVQTTGAGWVNHELQVAAAPSVSLRIQSARQAVVVEWALLLIAAGLALWCAGSAPRWLFVGICVAAAVTLVVPVDLVFAGRGVFLGLLVALGLAVLRRPARPRLAQNHSGTASWRPLPTTVTVLALLGGGGVLLYGAEAEQTSPALRRNLPVLIPVDAQRRPAGNVVYVPESLYVALHRRSAPTQDPAQSWLISSASYALQLGRGASGRAAVELTAAYDLTTQQAARVTLPLEQAGFDLLEATIDGQRVVAAWGAEGQLVEFPVAASGKSRLELKLRPKLQQDGPFGVLDIRIPQLAGSRLTVTAPAGWGAMQLPSALGAVTSESGSGAAMTQTIASDLGPTDRLTVRWRSDSSAPATAWDGDVGQLVWLRVEPTSVEVDAKFRFTVRAGSLERVQLTVDPRLRLQPLSDDQPVSGYEILDSSRQTILIDLDREYTAGSQVTLQTTFLYRRRAALGHVLVPRVEAAGGMPSQPWVAVSAADNLDVRLAPAPEQSIAPNEFAAAWGGSSELPQLAYRAAQSGAAAGLIVQPRKLRTLVREEADYLIGRDRLLLDYRAQAEIADGSALQQRMNIPSGLEVRGITVTQADENRMLRWSTDSAGQVTIFFDAPLTGPYEVELTGEMPIVIRDAFPLPIVSWEDAVSEASSLRISRRPDAQIELSETAGLLPRVSAEQPPESLAERLIAEFEGASDDSTPAAVSVLVRPNRPIVSSRLRTALSYVEQDWFVEADLDMQIQARSGVLDLVRLSVPGELSEPLAIEPQVPYRVDVVPGTTSRILTLRPSAAILGRWSVRLRFGLSSLADAHIQVPELQVLDTTDAERLLILPTKVGEQQLAWETSGLQQIAVPPAYRDRLPSSVVVTAYRAIGDTLRAAVRDVERVTGVPQVHLADYFVHCGKDGACYGVASFDLEPARLRECVLQMPAGLELVHTMVAGFPAMARSDGAGRWHIRLGPDQLPQRMEVVYAGVMRQSRGWRAGVRLEAPRLMDLQVERTLWTVRGPPRAERVSALLEHAVTDRSGQETIRLENAQAMLDLSSHVAARSSLKEFEIWRENWLRRRDSAAGAISAPSARPLDLLQPLAPETADRVGTALDAAAVWGRNAARQGPLAHFQLRGEAARFVVHFEDRDLRSRTSLGLLAGACLLIAALGLLLSRTAVIREWVIRWPHVLGAAVGLAYWLWFWPSVAGWMVVAVFVISAVRSPWRLRRG